MNSSFKASTLQVRMPDSVFNRQHRMRVAVACLLMGLILYGVVHIMKESNILRNTGSNVRKAHRAQLSNALKDLAKPKNRNKKAPPHPVIKEFHGTADDNPEMVQYVKSKKLIPPSTAPYNLNDDKKVDNSQKGQGPVLAKILHHMTGGFFVEVGAHDGETFSNTLYFERSLNWTGLLIEARDKEFKNLLSKHRKAYAISACLSLHPVAEIVHFSGNNMAARIDQKDGGVNVQCYPLYTLMLALGRNQIDLLSLDIEGDELKVLKTIPWDKIKIRLMLIEVNHIKEGIQEVIRYMQSVGYTFVKAHEIDLIFAKKDLLDQVENGLTKPKRPSK